MEVGQNGEPGERVQHPVKVASRTGSDSATIPAWRAMVYHARDSTVRRRPVQQGCVHVSKSVVYTNWASEAASKKAVYTEDVSPSFFKTCMRVVSKTCYTIPIDE